MCALHLPERQNFFYTSRHHGTSTNHVRVGGFSARFCICFIAITPLRRRRYRLQQLWRATIVTAVDQRLRNAKRSVISSRRRVVVTRTEDVVVVVNRRPDKVYSNSRITPSCQTNSNSTVSN